MPLWKRRQREVILDHCNVRSQSFSQERKNSIVDQFISFPPHPQFCSPPSTSTLTNTDSTCDFAPSSSSWYDGHSSITRQRSLPRSMTRAPTASASSLIWSTRSANATTNLSPTRKHPPDNRPTAPLLSTSLLTATSPTPTVHSRLRPKTPRSVKNYFSRLHKTELADMMGVSDGNNSNQPSSDMTNGRAIETSVLSDDPLGKNDASQKIHRSTDASGERNGFPRGVVASGSSHSNHTSMLPFGASSVGNSVEDSLHQLSNRSMLSPIIRVRPEYDTIYRKERKSTEPGKQNVVCVISVEIPSRRAKTSVEEEELLWMQKTSHRNQSAIDSQAKEGNSQVNEDFSLSPQQQSIRGLGDGDRKQEGAIPFAKEVGKEEDEEEAPFSFGATPAAFDSTRQVDPTTNIIEDLRRRISDWKGHTVDRFGPLILYDFVGVRQENVVREFYVYLFKEALLCVTEEKKKEKGLARLIGSDSKVTAPYFEELAHTHYSLAKLNKSALKLKGRIWLRHIKNCQETEVDSFGNCLSIQLEDENLDHFVLCLKDRGHLDLWKEKVTELLEDNQRRKEEAVAGGGGGGGAAARRAFEVEAKRKMANGASVPAAATSTTTTPMALTAAALHLDVNEDERAHMMSRRMTTASISNQSIQSGKSGGSNNHIAGFNTFESSSSLQAVSPPRNNFAISLDQSRNRFGPAPKQQLQTNPSTPSHRQWSSSGGLDPSLPVPDLLPHAPLDLVIMVSIPSTIGATTTSKSNALSTSSSAALKLRLIRSTLDFVVNHLGSNDRIALVAFSAGLDGLVRRTSLLNPCKAQSKGRLEQFIETIGVPWQGGGPDPFLEDIDRLGGSSDRTDTITAVNIGFDIVLQRKSKNPITSMILINDAVDTPRKGQMDLVMARAEAANVPIHCFGFGKNHDPSALWLISNQTRGSYTFIKEWYQLRECIAGCIGSMMSIALVDVKLHISVPSDNYFKVRKLTGPSGAIISSSGKDVDIELGEVRFGECKELFVELEFDFVAFMEAMQRESAKTSLITGLQHRKSLLSHYEKGSATDDFMQRLGLQGLHLSTSAGGGDDDDALKGDKQQSLQDSRQNSYDQAALENKFIEEIAVLEVDCGCRDPYVGISTSRIPDSSVLTLEVDGHSVDPISVLSAVSGGRVATALADAVVTRRRLEILVADMITRSLLLVSKRNHSQALMILSETRRIVDTVLQAIPVEYPGTSNQNIIISRKSSISTAAAAAAAAAAASAARGKQGMTNSTSSASIRSSQAKKQKDVAHRRTALSLLAIIEDLDYLIDGLEANKSSSFERTEKNFGAQQAMVLRDQKAWTCRTDTEWQFYRNIDNASIYAALAAVHAFSGRGA
ncbi:hypothetical protein CBS101457_004282 [Exobasidium rhododendri]|nr:hypothetical protein CBS101457_004282 [Exobasidium rhododendri]